ncbi:MAG: AAA family ATPase, partial [Candidatus Nanoarchaeia archaeon]
MTVIKRMYLRGFKSFANKTELVFGNGFNCVLGPNGSGKSNVCDSLCFVLGKTSAKEMRAEKSANLIYNGGKTKNPAKEAEVTIVFDNTSGKFPVKEKELAVTRLVKQNGISIYKINDEVVTRQQVLEVLRADKVDPNGHNIVLQGDIIGFMEMKSVDRRMIIEEIAGISGFEEKKQKCLNELAKVDGQLNEAEIILKERETNLRELKKERDQALRFKELQENIKDEKATYTHLRIKVKEEEVNGVESKKKECEDKIQKITSDIQELKDAITQFQEEIKRINTEIEEKGEKEQLILRKEIDNLKEELIKAGTRTEVCTTEIQKIKTRKQQLSINIKELEEKIQSLHTQKKELESNLKQLQQEEQGVITKTSQFREKHGIESDLSSALDELENNIETNIHSLQELQEKKEILIRTRTELTFRINALDERIQGLKGVGTSKEFEELKSKKLMFKETTIKLSKALNEDSSYATQLATSKQKFNELNQELTKLQSRQLSFLERSTHDLAVKKILDHRQELKGIHGTVAQLGKVDEQFALALEVAAGPRSQSIVVDSDATAQRCINYLKENRFGIATFLPLNKIKARIIEDDVKKLLNDKSVYGLATDLIKYSPEYKSVFSYVFGSTIIIDNIESARKIGIGRARMITLEGDLLEPSGAMIGGFRSAKRSFTFNESNLDEDIEHIQNEVNKI